MASVSKRRWSTPLRPSSLAIAQIRKRRTKMRAAIDSLPLLGASLALLFIVMLAEGTTPHHGTPLDLPLTSSAVSEPKALRDNAMKVIVTRDGSVFFRNQKIAPDDLPSLIREAVQNGAERKVYLAVDGRAWYGDAGVVIDQIRTVGIREICVLTEKRTQR